LFGCEDVLAARLKSAPFEAQARTTAQRGNAGHRRIQARQLTSHVIEPAFEPQERVDLDVDVRLHPHETTVGLREDGYGKVLFHLARELSEDEVIHAVEKECDFTGCPRTAPSDRCVETERAFGVQIRIAALDGVVSGVWAVKIQPLERRVP